MNKQKFTGIILLMALSLFGIIGVQLFWMNKAITIKEKQFDQQVNEALARASYRIERNQNANFMTSLFRSMPQVQMGYYSNPTKQPQGNDSIYVEFNEFWQDKDPKKQVIKGDNRMKVQKNNSNGIETIKYSFDTVINDQYGTQRIQSYSQITQPAKSNRSALKTESSDAQGSILQSQLNQVMEQMVLEFSIRDIPMQERVSNSIIKPTIEYELKNMNLPIKFEYGISNYRGQFYKGLQTSGFNKDKTDHAYKTVLFPNDILTESDHLVVYFPDKRNYLTSNMLWPFIGSLIFTLIILFTFYYTLKTIFNQKKVSEIKTDFINNMTHEFKTPIATISLAADSIINPNILNSPEKVSRFTNIIKEENRRMNRQVESVLKMALIDKKDFNLNMVETSVHPLIEKAVGNINLQVDQKGGIIDFECKAENDLLRIDETHFANVVYNLLDNANKYALNAPPEIKVTTYNQNGNFYMDISDNGIGMDQETLDKIFEKFYRVPTGDVHTVKGFGLGLSYVKAIVMQFKGDISVKSTKNKGSIFSLKIPLK